MDKIVKPGEPSGAILVGGKLKSSSSPFQQRVNQARREEVDPTTMPNRLCLMLDKSSSMAGSERVKGQSSKQRIELLREAVDNFIGRCNLNDTAIAIDTFPEGVALQLTSNPILLSGVTLALQASGNTPMHSCVKRNLERVPMTRGIIVSDGEATDWYDYNGDEDDGPHAKDDILKSYKEQGIPIDCVHISNDTGGEELLKRIAKETGGIFIKFTDVSNFASAFGYLTPGSRAMLTDGRVNAEQLGAKELR